MGEGLLQPTHLIIILVIVLIVFGPGKLPGIGGTLGKSLKEFKDSVEGVHLEKSNPLSSSTTANSTSVSSERIGTVPGSNPDDV